MQDMDIIRRRRGAWSHEEDSILINYISTHGLSLSWNQLALNAGLNRTGKSCRLRWLNYLSPNIVRGNFTLQDQLYIMQLHCFYGNRWSKIAEHLPGRTDNEIKNYWRTRVYKLAKLLKCDINSTEFRDFIANILVPRLSQQVQAHNNDDPLQIDYWAGFYDDILPEPVIPNHVPIVDSGPQEPFISYGYGYDDGFHGIQCQTSYNSEDDFFRLWP